MLCCWSVRFEGWRAGSLQVPGLRGVWLLAAGGSRGEVPQACMSRSHSSCVAGEWLTVVTAVVAAGVRAVIAVGHQTAALACHSRY